MFQTTERSHSLPLKNLFAEGEINPAAIVNESLKVQTEDSRRLSRSLTLHATVV